MRVIAELTVKSDDFALCHALTAAPQMSIEIERVVAAMEDRVMPYFWVIGSDHAEFETAFRDDESVRDVTAIGETDNWQPY